LLLFRAQAMWRPRPTKGQTIPPRIRIPRRGASWLRRAPQDPRAPPAPRGVLGPRAHRPDRRYRIGRSSGTDWASRFRSRRIQRSAGVYNVWHLHGSLGSYSCSGRTVGRSRGRGRSPGANRSSIRRRRIRCLHPVSVGRRTRRYLQRDRGSRRRWWDWPAE
jgi:hypothetical protein